VAAWHGDTFAARPPLEEFRKALNLQDATAKTGPYIVGDYMAAPVAAVSCDKC
jgi:hypothetical protein